LLPRPAKAVIFDMDGLLLDTERLYGMAFVQEASASGHDLPEELFKHMIGNSWAACLAMLIERFGSSFDPEKFRDGVIRRFYNLTMTELTLKAGVLEILDHLDTLGLPRAICTSSRRQEVDHHLSHQGLDGRFNAILAHGDYECSKPNPDPYLRAAKALGLAPEDCLALEDSYNGVRAAAAAGMMTIMVPDMLLPTEEMHSLCVRIALDLHEVKELLSL
jgi:HAD superfamily hydrolase (TIGR01509 family)